jgi:hypothetical protein
MKQDELMRAGLLLLILSAVILMSSCSVQRETHKSIYDVQFKSPIKFNKLDKCD